MEQRIRNSTAKIRKALLNFLKDRPLSEITVTEICTSAGLNRTTFYKYYRTTQDVLDELVQEQLNGFRVLLKEKKKRGKELFREILESLDRAEELYETKDGPALPYSFKTGLVATAVESGIQGWKARLPGMDALEAELAYEAILTGALHVALTPGGRENREKVIDTIMDMITCYIREHSEAA